jgi:hypothetical protein
MSKPFEAARRISRRTAAKIVLVFNTAMVSLGWSWTIQEPFGEHMICSEEDLVCDGETAAGFTAHINRAMTGLSAVKLGLEITAWCGWRRYRRRSLHQSRGDHPIHE